MSYRLAEQLNEVEPRRRVQVVDEEDNLISLKYPEEVGPSDIRRISAVWLTNPDRKILLTKRSATEDHSRGLWWAAAAGTLEEGDTYESNAHQELGEELGLYGVDLVPGPKLWIDDLRFFVQWYLGRLDVDLEALRLSPEVEEPRLIDSQDLIREIQTHPEFYTSGMADAVSFFLSSPQG